MKTFAIALLVVGLLGTALAGSGDRGFGVGLASGAVSGICAKYWVSQKLALDATVGAGYFYWRGLTADAAFAVHDYGFWSSLFNEELPGKWPFYYGGGVSVGVHTWGYNRWNSTVHTGVYVKVGTAFIPDDMPLDFFIEPGLGLYLLPTPYIAGAGKVGVRYWIGE